MLEASCDDRKGFRILLLSSVWGSHSLPFPLAFWTRLCGRALLGSPYLRLMSLGDLSLFRGHTATQVPTEFIDADAVCLHVTWAQFRGPGCRQSDDVSHVPHGCSEVNGLSTKGHLLCLSGRV